MTVYIVYTPPGSRQPELHTNKLLPHGMHYGKLERLSLAWSMRKTILLREVHYTAEAAVAAWRIAGERELPELRRQAEALAEQLSREPVLHASD